jgi:signal transduction histidine kinase
LGPAMDATPIRLDEVLNEVVEEFQNQAAQKKLHIITLIANDLPEINGSVKLFKSLWENLISNAIKYTLPGGEVTISLRLEAGQIEGEVCDTGIGIPQEEQAQLFNEFFRAKNAKKLNLHGTGLGLVIVKRIVEGIGGTIQVKSQEGYGSKFSFRLPVGNPLGVQVTKV